MGAAADATSNPLKITGGAVSTSTKITDNDLEIQKIVWYGATTNGHLLSVTDKNGNQIYKATMATTKLTENIEADFPLGLYAHGVYCNDLDSGELYVYFK